jgi:hypothetical protein
VSFVIIIHFKNHKMILRILLLSLLPLLSFAQSNSKVTMPTSNQSNDKVPVEIKRNALFNLEEIKVRWKKAALEICTGVPCTITNVCTVSAPSATTLTSGTLITSPITISTTTGATGIGTASGLPNGVSAAWASNVIKISGTPTVVAGNVNYNIPLTGCGSVNATGTIIVNASTGM